MQSVTSRGNGPKWGSEVRLFIADTDVVWLELLQLWLRDQGNQVEVASDGLACMSVLREFVPDVVVLDRELLWGGCDGVLDQMVSDADLAGIPIILVSDTDPGQDALLKNLPSPDAWLRKPFRLGELMTCLSRVSRKGVSNRMMNDAAIRQLPHAIETTRTGATQGSR